MSSGEAQHEGTEDLLELTFEAFRVAHQASCSAAEGIATSSLPILRSIREREKELDTLDRDIDDLVTTTITKVPEAKARELLACMKIATSLEHRRSAAEFCHSRGSQRRPHGCRRSS